MKFGIVLKPGITDDECIEAMNELVKNGINCDEAVEYCFENNETVINAYVVKCKAPIWRTAWFVVQNNFKFLRSLDDGLPVFYKPA